MSKNNDNGLVIWMTGLPGSGKTTIADSLSKRLITSGHKVVVLDGDEVRQNLSSDLGFSEDDRRKHAIRVAYVGKLLASNGIYAIVALISPYRSLRSEVGNLIGSETFREIYVKCTLDECIKRDPKNLYKMAIDGEITEFTGISSPYEEPENPWLVVDTENLSLDDSVAKIFEMITMM